MRGLLTQNPYTPPINLVRTLTTSFPLFEELLIIRDWLQDIAPCPPPTEATTGYWKFTKHSVLQSLRMGNNRDGLVRQMDPDAVNRGDQKMLASEDAVCCHPCLTFMSLMRSLDLWDLSDLYLAWPHTCWQVVWSYWSVSEGISAVACCLHTRLSILWVESTLCVNYDIAM